MKKIKKIIQFLSLFLFAIYSLVFVCYFGDCSLLYRSDSKSATDLMQLVYAYLACHNTYLKIISLIVFAVIATFSFWKLILELIKKRKV